MQDLNKKLMTRAFYKDIVCFCITSSFRAMKRNRKKTVTAEYYVFYVFRFFAFKPPIYLDFWGFFSSKVARFDNQRPFSHTWTKK